MRKFFKSEHIFRCFAAIIAIFMLFTLSINCVYALEHLQNESSESTAENAEPVNPTRKEGEKPILGASETGVLVDSASGRILFEDGGDKKMYPASTTKVMTALIAIEAIEKGEADFNNSVTITAEMLDGLAIDGSSIALKEGEIMSLENLLKGLMIASGNDAAQAIAIHIAGSIPAFVDKMNARAAELGATNTHFVNPHGLHDEDHYTTAADMAKFACAAMKLDKFRNIVDIAHVKIPPTNLTEEERYYINTNGLLSTMRYTDYFFKGTIGIKTGYTSDSGNCLVSAAARDGVELIGVIFGAKGINDSYGDSREMLQWGFEEFTAVTALAKGDMPCEIKVKQGRGTDYLTLAVMDTVKVVMPKDSSPDELEIRPNTPDAVYAPIFEGDEIGTVSVLYEGEEIGFGRLAATKEIKRSFFWPVMAFGEWLWSFTLVRVFVYVCGGVIVAFIALFFMALYRSIKLSKKRRSARRNRR